MKRLLLSIAIILASPAVLLAGKFEPYEIKPGIPYYSDEYTDNNGVSELGEEKNFEEVFQNYNYYEAVFDADKRMIIFKAYEKGAIEFSESYHYDSEGHLIKKVVQNSDGSETVVDF
ncbi:MAG: hypothetical protein QNI91_08835 [Arenicellales bacterium]|nr:hypothetical protein [Arenicellales bacterium]